MPIDNPLSFITHHSADDNAFFKLLEQRTPPSLCQKRGDLIGNDFSDPAERFKLGVSPDARLTIDRGKGADHHAIGKGNRDAHIGDNAQIGYREVIADEVM
ncbi:hypothetical protein D3C80_1933710 [compost metagenome]